MATIPNLSMSKAQLACVAVEAYLYGLYSVLAALTVWLLFTRRRMDLTTTMLVIHTIVMFGICTGHVCVILEYILTIFLYHNAAVEGDVINGHDGRFVAFLMMLFLNCMIGDLVVIWRVWVIWSRSWKAVMAPIFFWVASIVALCGSGYVISHPGTVQYADALAVSPWIASFMGFTLATNFTAVSAISYRYWLYQREVAKLGDQTSRSGNSNVSPIMVLIIESGSLYCVTWIVVLAAYASSSRTLDIVLLALVAQFTAMYPTLIVVLVCLRITQRDRMDRLHDSTIQFLQTSRTSCATCGQKSWRSNRLCRTHAVEVRVEALTQTGIELLPVNAKQDDSNLKHDNASQKAEEDSIEVC